jgi:hypothetical protein
MTQKERYRNTATNKTIQYLQLGEGKEVRVGGNLLRNLKTDTNHCSVRMMIKCDKDYNDNKKTVYACDWLAVEVLNSQICIVLLGYWTRVMYCITRNRI